ncbi:MAG: methyltransferase domain-containing protein [Acidobacteria bacterium]|nr:methyltransferase domain-containing protein [Acidobacteriota bacterium]MCZ6491617.1 methyltransferase domain-containing protein [Acidobacteriota bacterium]MCZ6753471.1 methyltransferase domain-containing protein [Acidobacteriota bacterium]
MTKQSKFQILWFAFLCLFGIGLTNVSAFQLEQRPAKDYIERMDRPGRVAGLRVDEVLEKLQLKPGDVVADIGSGSGVFSIPMARAIGPNGTLYAVDIDQEMIDFVGDRAKKAGLKNVRIVLGEYADPKLPVRDLDVAFFHRVLHMIELRQAYVNAVAKYLKPDGRIVIIEKEPEESNNWMWLRRSDVDSWMAAIGFYPAERFGVFDDKWFVSYQRPYGNSVLLDRD